jgi:hypothetical protein
MPVNRRAFWKYSRSASSFERAIEIKSRGMISLGTTAYFFTH